MSQIGNSGFDSRKTQIGENMATTWEELREQVVDLGFETDDITSEDEYERLIRNSVNRAFDLIFYSVVPYIKDYYKIEGSWGYEDEDGEWILPKPRHVTSETEDTQRFSLADNLMPLVPLLAAHYVWLDDDITKATMYWNEYDQLKDAIIAVCRQPRKATIEGGW